MISGVCNYFNSNGLNKNGNTLAIAGSKVIEQRQEVPTPRVVTIARLRIITLLLSVRNRKGIAPATVVIVVESKTENLFLNALYTMAVL